MSDNYSTKMEKNTPSSLGDTSPDHIDPNLTRHGKTWLEVEANVKEILKNYPPQVVKRELEKERALFVKGPTSVARARWEALRKDIEETPRPMRRRALQNWAKIWL